MSEGTVTLSTVHNAWALCQMAGCRAYDLDAQLMKAKEARDALLDAFQQLCDELGCEYDSDLALKAILDLKERASERGAS
jgi:hypothetical protein